MYLEKQYQFNNYVMKIKYALSPCILYTNEI